MKIILNTKCKHIIHKRETINMVNIINIQDEYLYLIIGNLQLNMEHKGTFFIK